MPADGLLANLLLGLVWLLEHLFHYSVNQLLVTVEAKCFTVDKSELLSCQIEIDDQLCDLSICRHYLRRANRQCNKLLLEKVRQLRRRRIRGNEEFTASGTAGTDDLVLVEM